MKTVKIAEEFLLVDPKSLIPYNKNAKKHSKAQMLEFSKSFEEFGFDVPVVVDKDMVIIKGHGRTQAAIEYGLEKVSVIVRSDQTAEQARASRIADNQIVSTDFDTVLLQEEVAELDLSGFNTDALGFTERELSMLTDDLTSMDTDSIMDDLELEIDEAAERNDETIKEAQQKPIRIADALGFKTIPGESEREIAQFMAKIEESTGKVGDQAFLEFVGNFLNN